MTVLSPRLGCAPPAIIDIQPPPRADRWLLPITLFGIVLRLLAYARNPSLWGDEAMLALNVLHRSPAELLGPLDDNQGAPIGYLLLLKLSTVLFGGSEYALRLPSVLAGLLGGLAFLVAVRRELPVAAQRWAVVLFALSPWLIGYAGEVKQYSCDAAVACGLIAVRHRPRVFALAGMLAVWLSHPALFVLAGLGLPLLRSRPGRWTVAAWACSFMINYVLILRRLGENAYLRDYWAGQFCPLVPDLGWLIEHLFAPFADAGGFGLTAALAVAAAAIARRQRFFLLPLGAALLASAAGQYPFSGRLLLFAVPGLLLAVAGGFIQLPKIVRYLILLGPLLQLGHLLDRPLHAEDARGAANYIRASRSADEPIFVTHSASPGWRYYAKLHAEIGPDVRQDLARYRGLLENRRGYVVLLHYRPEELAAVRVAFPGVEVWKGADAVVFHQRN
jgi:hypothetical protein